MNVRNIHIEENNDNNNKTKVRNFRERETEIWMMEHWLTSDHMAKIYLEGKVHRSANL